MAAPNQATLTVSYTLSPPEGTNTPPSLSLSTAHTFVVEAERTANIAEFYAAVRKAIASAKERLGEDLTIWRDAVADAEAGKEKATKAAQAEDEDEEEDE